MTLLILAQLAIVTFVTGAWAWRRRRRDLRYASVGIIWALCATTLVSLVLLHQWHWLGALMYAGGILWLIVSIRTRIWREDGKLYYRGIIKTLSLTDSRGLALRLQRRWPDEYPNTISLAIVGPQGFWRELSLFGDPGTIVRWFLECGGDVQGESVLPLLDKQVRRRKVRGRAIHLKGLQVHRGTSQQRDGRSVKRVRSTIHGHMQYQRR